jgi:hypothetical protein
MLLEIPMIKGACHSMPFFSPKVSLADLSAKCYGAEK